MSKDDLWAALRMMGCAVCRFRLGLDDLDVPAIHHISGKARPELHWKTIPLCKIHHQYGTAEHPSIHSYGGKYGGKAQFEAAYGTEVELLAECEEYVGEAYWTGREVRQSKILRR